MFCFANSGKVFGGGCESSCVLEGQRGSLALSCSVPPSQLGDRDGLCTAQGVSLPPHSHGTWEVLL